MSLVLPEKEALERFFHCLIVVWLENWPDLRSPKSKLQDINFVGTGALINSWKFYIDPLKLQPRRNRKYFWTLGHLTWPGEMTWDDLGLKFSGKVREGCMKKSLEKNQRPGFSAIREKTWGPLNAPPPPPARPGNPAPPGLFPYPRPPGGRGRIRPPAISGTNGPRGGVRKLSTRFSQSILTILRSILSFGWTSGQKSNFDVSIWWSLRTAISIAFAPNSPKVISKGY